MWNPLEDGVSSKVGTYDEAISVDNLSFGPLEKMLETALGQLKLEQKLRREAEERSSELERRLQESEQERESLANSLQQREQRIQVNITSWGYYIICSWWVVLW